MTIVSDLQNDFKQILKYGEIVRFKYYSSVGTGEYDDDITLIQSGSDLWVSGMVQPIKNNQFSSDSLLLQQGKILYDDKKLYIDGDVQTSGLGPIKIGVGSPIIQEYRILEDGQVTEWGVNGSVVYKKLYLKYLTNGSFVGEN